MARVFRVVEECKASGSHSYGKLHVGDLVLKAPKDATQAAGVAPRVKVRLIARVDDGDARKVRYGEREVLRDADGNLIGGDVIGDVFAAALEEEA